MNVSSVHLDLERGAKGCQSVIEQALILEDVAEIQVGCGGTRLEAQPLLETGARLHQQALLAQGISQVDVGLDVIRLEAKALLIAGHGLIQLP